MSLARLSLSLAAVVGLIATALAGATSVTIVNRDARRGEELARVVTAGTGVPATYVPWDRTYAVPDRWDDVSDEAALKEAHEQGRAVVVRAGSAEQVKAALARPEVACVLVPADKPELLELDLTELTYG